MTLTEGDSASALGGEPKSTVLIPTYKRPANLDRCLDALSKQDPPASLILIVRRTDDAETEEIFKKWESQLPVEEVCVTVPGVVHSLNSGLDRIASKGDGGIVCILDDDTAPHPGWLARILAIFAAEPRVGGIGGRDHIYDGGVLQTGEASDVGIIRWYGRFLGNHHLGSGPRRDVDYLKGANMSFRMSAIGDLRFDTRLLGSGAQVHNDLAFSLGVGNRGWRIVYDPEVAVDHFRGERFDSDKRGAPAMDAAENMAVNFYLTLRCYVEPPYRRAMALLYARLIGLRHTPGFVRGVLSQLRSNKDGVALRTVCVRAWRTARKMAV
jgi:cellulose synthase/poly-beta-1,6-N-acetylglucosamine synthase-like glycosyltransferase